MSRTDIVVEKKLYPLFAGRLESKIEAERGVNPFGALFLVLLYPQIPYVFALLFRDRMPKLLRRDSLEAVRAVVEEPSPRGSLRGLKKAFPGDHDSVGCYYVFLAGTSLLPPVATFLLLLPPPQLFFVLHIFS